jgi:hypothetical protein
MVSISNILIVKAIQQICSSEDVNTSIIKEKLKLLCKMDPNKSVRLKSIQLLEKISDSFGKHFFPTIENVELLILKSFDKDLSVRLYSLRKLNSFGSFNIELNSGKMKSKIGKLIFESLMHENQKIKDLGELICKNFSI